MTVEEFVGGIEFARDPDIDYSGLVIVEPGSPRAVLLFLRDQRGNVIGSVYHIPIPARQELHEVVDYDS